MEAGSGTDGLMNTSSLGNVGESAAAEYLERHGYEVVERNFRTRQCEIDVVARKGSCIYFVEVKYRGTSSQGTGLEYVTPKKQKQMRFAAEVWMQEHAWEGDAVLSAIEIDHNFRVTEFVEDIS
jgi:uncharacterized protein (TIGR00252 family)